MKKEFRKIKLAFMLLISCLSVLLTVNSLSWFSGLAKSFRTGITQGSFIADYFHTGKGTEDDPFVITRPIHYYHLVELYQRKGDEYAAKKFYYELGYHFKGLDGYYVYDYDDTGNIKTEVAPGQAYVMELDPVTKEEKKVPLSKVLNMQVYSGESAIIPCGTSEVPFNGEFDGNSLTISNLHITAIEKVVKNDVETYIKSSDIGIFGYVDQISDDNKAYIHDCNYSNVTIDITGLDKAATLDTSIETTSHISHLDNDVYIGYLAGHVQNVTVYNEGEALEMVGVFDKIYLNNCSVIGGEYSGMPISQYGFFGHIDTIEGTAPVISTLLSQISQQTSETTLGGGGSGKDATWGGSLGLTTLYLRMVGYDDSDGNHIEGVIESRENSNAIPLVTQKS